MLNLKPKELVTLSMFVAIILMLAYTPIGYIQLGVIKATIIHVPVIVGSILLGPKKGAFLGALFGLTSFLSNTFTPVLLSFAFSPLIPVPGTDGGNLLAVIICFVPRILVGIVPFYIYKLLSKISKHKFNIVSFAIAGIFGSLTNTIFVMGGIYFIFKDSFAVAKSIPLETVYTAVLAIILGNGLPEAFVAGVITACLCQALMLNKQVKYILEI